MDLNCEGCGGGVLDEQAFCFNVKIFTDDDFFFSVRRGSVFIIIRMSCRYFLGKG